MPSLITHNLFGNDVYDKLYSSIGGSRDEHHAFILGNQGPDPLFYAHVDPLLRRAHGLGSRMHREQTPELMVAMKRAVTQLDEADRSIGRAYALGFLCHYLLDRTIHPLVYYYEHAICDAGIEGLDRQDHSDVHAVIETELDEMMLTVKLETTSREFNPTPHALSASDHVLDVISQMYVNVADSVFAWPIPANSFRASAKHMRTVQSKLFYSQRGIKRRVLGDIESLFRRHSFLRAMSHRGAVVPECDFDNHEHAPWENPLTGEIATTCFWDLYEEARGLAFEGILAFDAPSFDLNTARSLTRERNFAGESCKAVIIAVDAVE